MRSGLDPTNRIVFHHVADQRGGFSRSALVTVIIASYNYASYICETLDSVAAQTHPEIELVIVDDCSTDDSVSTLR